MKPIIIILISIVLSILINYVMTNSLKNDIKYNKNKINELLNYKQELKDNLYELATDYLKPNKDLDEEQQKSITRIIRTLDTYFKNNESNKTLLKNLPNILDKMVTDIDNIKNRLNI